MLQHRPPPEQPEKDGIVCSICGYPTKPAEIMAAGLFNVVRKENMAPGRWPLQICRSCLQNMDEIDRGGAELAERKAGLRGTEHV